MKTIKQTFVIALFGLLLMSNSSIAQDEKSYLITVTKMHWNMNLDDFSMDEWKKGEKEYLDKVVKKNEFIVGQIILTHYFTADNTELLLVTTYDNWEAIEKAGKRSDELEKLAWPDEKVAKAYFDKKSNYYAGNHSDEIYATMKGAKMNGSNFDKEVLYYIRVSHFANQKDGSNKEYTELNKQYFDAVINKNEFVKAYYPNVHAWGSDNTQFTEVFVVDDLASIEKSFDKNSSLFKAAWNTEAKQKEFGKKMGKYFTGVHRDYIYKLVPELSK
ncbi:hypothetical protein [Flavobacterium sp.]|jgi:hypothetical protein|uniref:hypothetical protein n=1 Tax=Flavobacterium sp. TaxID=239 RepID=UPI00375256FC